MTTQPHDPGLSLPAQRRAHIVTLDLVVPVYNEQRDLERSVRRLHHYLRQSLPYSYRIIIADNASTDATARIAESLAAEIPEVTSVRLERKGRGGALRTVWMASDAQVLAYCDVDLSTELTALPVLLAPVICGHSSLAIGTRLARGATVERCLSRELISRAYNLILRAFLGAQFSDAQCGFKAIHSEVARRLLPRVEDDSWFFDTELLVLAQRAGLRVHEVPVDWAEDPDSSVNIVSTVLADLRGVLRLLCRGGAAPDVTAPDVTATDVTATGAGGSLVSRLRHQLGGFAAVGVASTALHLLLFLGLRVITGAVVANALALVLATGANTAANRRFTFGLRGKRHLGLHHLQGLILLGVGIGLTSLALAVLSSGWPGAGALAQVVVLGLTNLVTTVLRFSVFRRWRSASSGQSPSGSGAAGASVARRPACGS